MALLDSLKEFYGKMEDGYYSLLDSIQGKGVPVYRVVDAIEGANIPSFPIAVILAFLVLFGLYSVIAGALGGATLSVSVQDSDLNPVRGATVTVTDAAGNPVGLQATDDEGLAVLKVPMN